mgnify:CR=1 FL=1
MARVPRSRAAFPAGSALALLLMVAGAEAQNPRDPLKGMEEVKASQGLDSPAPNDAIDPLVAQGQYLVGLLGCSSCHTDGALIGEPDPELALAGSSIGIAYTNPMQQRHPGVIYPSNLTPDPDTGIGDWTEDDIVTMLREGRSRHGVTGPMVMPWINYSRLTDTDAIAIARYLKSLPPVRHRVPNRVAPGTPTERPLVHVGLYRRQ